MKHGVTLTLRVAVGVLGVCIVAIAILGQNDLTQSERLVNLAARAPYRSVEARLTDFPHKQFQPAEEVRSDSSTLGSLVAIGEILTDRNINAQDAATANLLLGRPSAAAALLRKAAATDNGQVEIWTDYSAALYEEGRTQRRAELFARSLAAADHALELDRTAPAALFNRALALEALGLSPFARIAYERYLLADADSAWAGEAKERLRALNRPTRKEQWQEAVQRAERDANASSEAIGTLVDRFPQQARTWAEGIQLTSWAEALQAGDSRSAELALQKCKGVAAGLHRWAGEQFLYDVVKHLEQIPSETDRARLANALVRYKKGRILFSKRQVVDALPLFSESARTFSDLDSPMALLAAYYAASAKFDSGHTDEALADLDSILRNVPARYVALRAQLRWEQGSAYASTRRLTDATEAYGEAEALFARLGETEFHARMQHIRARLLTTIGRASEAWQVRGIAFAEAGAAGDDALLEFAVDEAAQDALVQREWELAHSFFDLVLSLPSGTPRRQSNARVWRALASWRSGKHERALHEIEDGERSLGTIHDTALRDSASHDLAFAKALLIEKQNPREALALLDSAIGYVREFERLHALPAMLLEHSRIQRALGDLGGATSDLEDAVEIMERSGSTLERDDIRDSFFSTSNVLYEEFFDVLIAAGNTDEAFEVAERRRARVLYERVALVPPLTPVLPIDQISRALPVDTVMLHYTVAAGRVVLFVLGDGRHRMHRLEVRADDLVSQIASFRRAIGGDDRDRILRLGARLSEKLIAPAADVLTNARYLVIVPAPAMETLPFAALQAPGRAAYLIEQVAIVLAPSANVYASLAQRKTSDHAEHALIVANPAFDRRRFASLPALADAAEEGREIAAMHRSSTLLIGNDATLQHLRLAMSESSIIHLATHTALDESDPSESAILLTPMNDDGMLYLRDIALSNLRTTELVILAGCRTALRADRNRDLSSLTAAFLAAGTRNVVGTLWNVSDSSTRMFFEAFHRSLIVGKAPADAVRNVQLAMINDDLNVSKPSAWAAIQLYGPGREREK